MVAWLVTFQSLLDIRWFPMVLYGSLVKQKQLATLGCHSDWARAAKDSGQAQRHTESHWRIHPGSWVLINNGGYDGRGWLIVNDEY